MMLANWQARHGVPGCFHGSCLAQLGHAGWLLLRVAGSRYVHLAQKARIVKFLTVCLTGHLQRNTACRHSCRVSAEVGGVSSRLEDEVASSRNPKELAM